MAGSSSGSPRNWPAEAAATSVKPWHREPLTKSPNQHRNSIGSTWGYRSAEALTSTGDAVGRPISSLAECRA